MRDAQQRHVLDGKRLALGSGQGSRPSCPPCRRRDEWVLAARVRRGQSRGDSVAGGTWFCLVETRVCKRWCTGPPRSVPWGPTAPSSCGTLSPRAKAGGGSQVTTSPPGTAGCLPLLYHTHRGESETRAKRNVPVKSTPLSLDTSLSRSPFGCTASRWHLRLCLWGPFCLSRVLCLGRTQLS